MNKKFLFLATSIVAVSSMHAESLSDVRDCSKEIVCSMIIATKNKGREEFSERILSLKEEIESKLDKKIEQSTFNEIMNVLNEYDCETIYYSLTKEEKEFAIEGLFLEFLNTRNKDNLKTYIERLIFIISKGTPIHDRLEMILKQNEKVVIEIKNMGRVTPALIAVRWQKKLLTLGTVLEPVVSEILSGSKLASKYKNHKNLEKIIKETLLARIALN